MSVIELTDDTFDQIIAGPGYTLLCLDGDGGEALPSRRSIRRTMDAMERKQQGLLRVAWARCSACCTAAAVLDEGDWLPAFLLYREGVFIGKYLVSGGHSIFAFREWVVGILAHGPSTP